MTTKPTLQFVETLVRAAGDILRAGAASRPAVTHKSAIDLVTEFDHRSEAYLLQEIRRAFPAHRILAEESGGLAGNEDCCWVVDPLDGTVNYAHGLPIYAVSLAYAERGVVRLGVVYDPSRDECFAAERGCGAACNGQPIRASRCAELNRALLVTGFAYDIRTNANNNLEQFARLSLRAQAVRRLGSAALDLCYVGCGRFDGYWELSLQPWDLAAGALIAEEAGAAVTGADGADWRLAPPCSALAANPALHAQLLSALRET